ncbi:MAG: OmpA family protein [Rhodospirillales bacterium]|nr:MAG: OmpA family protein [Rhodospirillales bacterium]
MISRLVPLAALGLCAALAGATAQTPPKPATPPTSAPMITPGARTEPPVPAPATTAPAAPAATAAPTPVPPTQLQAEFAVAVGDTVMFNYQSKDLTLRSLKILDNQAVWLKGRADLKITVEAYCDDDLEGAKAREFCLSRGREVRDYLVKQGVAAERITVVAFEDAPAPRRAAKAEAKPDAKPDPKKAGKSEKARKGNRRAVTRVTA